MSQQHNRTLKNIGYNKLTKQIRMLSNLGVSHTVTDALGHSQTGQWGMEPNAHIRLHDITETNARRVASMFGKSFHQDGVGLTHGGFEAEYNAHMGGATGTGFHPVLGVKKVSGRAYDMAEIAHIGSHAAQHGVSVETNEDHTRLDFHDYEGDAGQWQKGVKATLHTAGLEGAGHIRTESAVQSDYVGKAEYQRDLYAKDGSFDRDGSYTEAGPVFPGHSNSSRVGQPGAFVHATLALARSHSQALSEGQNEPGPGYVRPRPRIAHPGPATSPSRY